MKTKIVITDLTRMYQGRVCIAGYNHNRNCIRPVLPPPGIPEDSLFQNNHPIVYPFALVELDLLEPDSQPPHTEDFFFDPNSLHFIRQVHNREEVLHWSLFNTVEEIFAQPIHNDFSFYVMECQGERSLGTLKPETIIEAVYEAGVEKTWDYRLKFADQAGNIYRLKITDLTWQYHCTHLRSAEHTPIVIASELTKMLQSSDQVYLRIGLARGWKKFPERCYLQITGIYTFPDYLQVKTFVYLKPLI